MKFTDTENMKNNPIEELRRMESPVTEEGWASILNDPRYGQKFGQSPKPSPKGRIAIVACAVAVLISIPVLIKTLTHKSSETAKQTVNTETSAPQTSANSTVAAAPQTARKAQTQTTAQAAPKQTVSTVNGAAAHEQNTLVAVTEARSQAPTVVNTKEPTPAVTKTQPAVTTIPERPVTTPATPKTKSTKEPVKPSQTVANTEELPKSDSEAEEPVPESDQFFIPTAFTPNGDGLNDLFYVKANFEPRNFEMTILNRNGERVFQTRDMNIGWDGKIRGATLPFGMYVYIIKYKDSQGNEQQQQGQILLIP